MLKREFKINLKSFIIWFAVLAGMYLMVYLMYPYIINDETIKSMDQMMKVMPPEMLKAFNMDMASISTAYGWLKTEGFVYVLLILGIYSSILGGTIVLKEESDKTIEYLGTLPVTRSKIMTNKIIVGISYIIAMTLLFFAFNYICLTISGDFAHKEFILLSLTPLFVSLPLFAINLFISMFLHKTRSTIGISLGMVFFFYILNVLSELSSKVEAVKYFSIYTLADVRNVITNVRINPMCIYISLGITLLFIGFSYMIYDKKELV